MKKGFVACVMLGGCATLACAQDSGSAAGTGKPEAKRAPDEISLRQT